MSKYKAQLICINSSNWEFEGKKGTRHQAQMIITSAREVEGKMLEETFVVRKNLPETYLGTPPGEYLLELAPFADGKGMLDFRVVSLVPLGGRPSPKAAAAAAS
ncbi:hypothetical protein ACNRBV_04135 [Ralstonia pseudosolanacearum]|uniref:hypothetical protein n=1 Tax=Ralstonia pseudosolanacearum TaxID=1310165 RepID=UPI0018A51400|nr:hypothetical protein [Ralstonia pseudosolanacearum]BCL92307.1 hypothetical protein MAFF211479_20080 [Ralstonia solanacearum]BCN04873.1 hypothetical protein RPSB_20100 [Ralstonia solanacearum]